MRVFHYLIVLTVLVAVTGFFQVSFGQQLSSSNLSNSTNINGTNMSVRYNMTNGNLISINAYLQSKSLVIHIEPASNGNLTIDLPRTLIDAKENGSSVHFIVLADNHGSRYVEVGNTLDRTLTISFNQRTDKIQIIGTQMLTPIASTTTPTVTQNFNSSSNQPQVIVAPATNGTPTIDGKWDAPNEWDVSRAVTLEKNNTKMYILAQHDNNYLYVMADVVTDQTAPSSALLVRNNLFMIFDTDNFRGDVLGSKEIGIGTSHTFLNGTETNEGFGSEVWTYNNQSNPVDLSVPVGYNSSTSFSSANDPFESDHDHRMYEFRIPLSLLHNSNEYGFALKAQTCSNQIVRMCIPIYTVFWPDGTIMSVPYMHGILELSNATANTSYAGATATNNYDVIVGIVVGVGVAAFVAYFVMVRRTRKKIVEPQELSTHVIPDDEQTSQ